MNAIPLADRPHALYRFYDRQDVLLYIGITAALPTRLMNHDDTKPWWTEVHHITVEHIQGRDAVLAAEKRAIRTEKPRWNVQHNGDATTSRMLVPGRGGQVRGEWGPVVGNPSAPRWRFNNLRGDFERTVPLWLRWEVENTACSDDYAVEDIDADELWCVWRTRWPRYEEAEKRYGPGAVRIWWFVEGPGVLEFAPYQEHVADTYAGDRDFLTYFTIPYEVDTYRQIQWSRLPVIDKVWRTTNLPKRYQHKGGFIQEATGWKPAPLQPYVNADHLARAAGLYAPGGWPA